MHPHEDVVVTAREPKAHTIVLGISAALFFLFLSVIGVLYALFFFLNTPSKAFPVGTPVSIPEGSSFTVISSTLKHAHVIQSETLFRLFVVLNGSASTLRAGTFTYPRPLTTSEVVHALERGDYDTTEVSITFPEGSDYHDVARIITEALPQTNREDVLVKAKQHEGFLFPETYHVSPKFTVDEMLELMKKTFDETTASLSAELPSRSLSPHDWVVFASILEKEGSDETSMRTIAGILHKRLSINMPLQVDATFAYYLGKESSEVTVDDLKSDSLYNTYRHRGLPPEPIGNPGLVALKAVLDPIETDYLYYLTDTEGVFHYAKTFEEHKRNKERYLR